MSLTRPLAIQLHQSNSEQDKRQRHEPWPKLRHEHAEPSQANGRRNTERQTTGGRQDNTEHGS